MITVIINNDLRESGVTAAANAYNAGLPEGSTPLTPTEYLQRIVDGAADSYVSQFRVGTVSSGDFVLRFTPEEYGAISAASTTDPIIAGFLARVRESQEVVLYSVEVKSGMEYLVAQSLLTQERADEILEFTVTPTPVPQPPAPPEPEPTPEPTPE